MVTYIASSCSHFFLSEPTDEHTLSYTLGQYSLPHSVHNRKRNEWCTHSLKCFSERERQWYTLTSHTPNSDTHRHLQKHFNHDPAQKRARLKNLSHHVIRINETEHISRELNHLEEGFQANGKSSAEINRIHIVKSWTLTKKKNSSCRMRRFHP